MHKSHRAALELANTGLAVFACQSCGKAPTTSHGFYDASTETSQIDLMWLKTWGANIAIATGSVNDLVVVDLDGPESEAAWRKICSGHDELPETTEVLTPGRGGGRHIYFSASGRAIHSCKLAERIDVKGDGGYVLCPPSVHPDGPRYEWGHGLEELPLAPLPDWLFQLISGRARTGDMRQLVLGKMVPNLERYHQLLTEPMPEGTRNRRMTELCGYLTARHRIPMDPVAVYHLMMMANEIRGEPPLPETDIEIITLSITSKDKKTHNN